MVLQCLYSILYELCTKFLMFWFAVVILTIHVIYSPMFIRAASLVVGQSSYCPSVGEVNLKHKSKSLISQTEFALAQLDYLRSMRVTWD